MKITGSISQTEQIRPRRILIAALAASVVLLLNTGTVGAWAIANGYAGDYTNQYSVHSGTLWGDYDPNRRTFGPASSFHWTPEGSNWIRANELWDGSRRNKVAISYHSEGTTQGSCNLMHTSGWRYSDLPHARAQRRTHCPAYDEEIRILSDGPGPIGNVDYYTQVEYINGNIGASAGNFNISSYWLDYWDFPSSTGGAGGGGRDYMQKHCFNSPNLSTVYFYSC